MNFEPFALIKTLLIESEKPDNPYLFDLQRNVTEKFVAASEHEQNQLFSLETLEMIFEFASRTQNASIVHILNLLQLFSSQIQKLKLFIDSSDQNFNLFFAMFNKLDNPPLYDFYLYSLRLIRIDNQRTTQSLSKLLIDYLIPLQDVEMAATISQLISSISAQNSIVLNLQILQDLTVTLGNESITESTVGLVVILPKYYEIAGQIISNTESLSMYKSAVTTMPITPRKKENDFNYRKHSTDDEKSNDPVPNGKSCEFNVIKNLKVKQVPQIPKLQKDPFILLLNEDPFPRKSSDSKTSMAGIPTEIFETQETDFDAHKIAQTFLTALYSYVRSLMVELETCRPVERCHILQLICRLSAVALSQLDQKMMTVFEDFGGHLFEYATGTACASIVAILSNLVKFTKRNPFSIAVLSQAELEEQKIFTQSRFEIIQKLNEAEARFCEYIGCNGLVPFKYRSQTLSGVIEVLRRKYEVCQASFTPASDMLSVLELIIIRQREASAVWNLYQFKILGNLSVEREIDLSKFQLEASTIRLQWQDLLDAAETADSSPHTPIFRINLEHSAPSSQVGNTKEKCRGVRMSIKIGSNAQSYSSDEDDTERRPFSQQASINDLINDDDESQ